MTRAKLGRVAQLVSYIRIPVIFSAELADAMLAVYCVREYRYPHRRHRLRRDIASMRHHIHQIGSNGHR